MSYIMDLSKAFDTLNHSLLIAKLEAYFFNSLSLEFMKTYRTNRKHRTEKNHINSLSLEFMKTYRTNRKHRMEKNRINSPSKFHNWTLAF